VRKRLERWEIAFFFPPPFSSSPSVLSERAKGRAWWRTLPPSQSQVPFPPKDRCQKKGDSSLFPWIEWDPGKVWSLSFFLLSFFFSLFFSFYLSISNCPLSPFYIRLPPNPRKLPRTVFPFFFFQADMILTLSVFFPLPPCRESRVKTATTRPSLSK